jgi:hypothetical protein
MEGLTGLEDKFEQVMTLNPGPYLLQVSGSIDVNTRPILC